MSLETLFTIRPTGPGDPSYRGHVSARWTWCFRRHATPGKRGWGSASRNGGQQAWWGEEVSWWRGYFWTWTQQTGWRGIPGRTVGPSKASQDGNSASFLGCYKHPCQDLLTYYFRGLAFPIPINPFWFLWPWLIRKTMHSKRSCADCAKPRKMVDSMCHSGCMTSGEMETIWPWPGNFSLATLTRPIQKLTT